MNDVAELRAELARWTYKPGWRLTIVPGGGGPYAPALLTVDYPADDSRNPGHQVKITSRYEVHPEMVDNPDRFGRWLQDVLRQAEDHEMREYLRRDGQLFDDPHAQEGPR